MESQDAIFNRILKNEKNSEKIFSSDWTSQIDLSASIISIVSTRHFRHQEESWGQKFLTLGQNIKIRFIPYKTCFFRCISISRPGLIPPSVSHSLSLSWISATFWNEGTLHLPLTTKDREAYVLFHIRIEIDSSIIPPSFNNVS